MILGGKDEIKSPAYTPTPIIYFAFIILPVFLSVSTLATRAARKLNESIVSFYMAASLLLVCSVVCLSSGQDLYFFLRFSGVDWLCLFFMAFATVMG